MPKISALPPMTTADGDDEAPIVDDSASTTKKFTLTVLKEWLQSLAGWISTAMLANDSVTATKIDWASTGADAGIWWEELGRTTLSSAGDTISVQNLGARKYLKIIADIPNSGNITVDLRFNNDSGNNYGIRSSANGAADVTSGSASSISILNSASSALMIYDVLNVAAREKLVALQENPINTATGAATPPSRQPGVAKWANTANQITRVDIVNGAAGDFAIGAEVIVLGHN